MMGYLDRLKGAVSEKQAPTVLQKLQKAPFDSFCSAQGGHVAEIEAPAPLWGRVAILEPGGRTVEVDTPSGWTLVEWQAYAERYHGPGCAVTPIAGLPEPRAPVNLDEALRAACEGVAGITLAEFRALLSPEDITDVAAGAIHAKTLKGFAASFAEGIQSGRVVVLPGWAPSP